MKSYLHFCVSLFLIVCGFDFVVSLIRRTNITSHSKVEVSQDSKEEIKKYQIVEKLYFLVKIQKKISGWVEVFNVDSIAWKTNIFNQFGLGCLKCWLRLTTDQLFLFFLKEYTVLISCFISIGTRNYHEEFIMLN